jgi:hypothetical protein
MARIRYLKPDFFTDEDLGELKFETRLTFAGLWCHADKAGRLEDRPKYLKAMIFPYDNIDMEKQLDILATSKNHGSPFINRYESEDGKRLIQISAWERHQKPHHTEKESIFLPPESESSKFCPPHTPLLKEKGMGMEKQLEASTRLKDGEITVKEPLKKKYGEFQNVTLSDEEKKKLIEKFGKNLAKRKIEELSMYLASKGKKYKNHYATILSWDRKNREEKGNDLTNQGQDIISKSDSLKEIEEVEREFREKGHKPLKDILNEIGKKVE